MLVEAKVKSRDFGPQDVDDLATLLAAEARKRAVAIHIDSTLAGTVPLPAAPLRQILMNLLLNAVQASDPSTTVYCAVRHDRGELTIDTRNAGRPIPQEVMNHLFEPFSSGKENGSGLGLWVTYQIVSQLGGRIATESLEGSTSFVVVLPTGEPT
jgi:signal transduction histidine kinase